VIKNRRLKTLSRASFANLKGTSTSVTADQLRQCASVCDSLCTPIETVALSRLAGILTTWIQKCSCSLKSEDEGSCCGLSTPFGMHFVTVAAGRRTNLSGHCNRPASLRRSNRLRWRFPLIGSGVWGQATQPLWGFGQPPRYCSDPRLHLQNHNLPRQPPISNFTHAMRAQHGTGSSCVD
jgi:hypothetical protein